MYPNLAGVKKRPEGLYEYKGGVLLGQASKSHGRSRDSACLERQGPEKSLGGGWGSPQCN